MHTFKSYIQESYKTQKFDNIIKLFIPYCKKELNIKKIPTIHFIKNSKFAEKIGAFGEYSDNKIIIDIENRQPMDILRTLAHELTHYSQHMHHQKKSSNKAGSQSENQANKIAGIILRNFANKHSELFKLKSL